MQDYYSDYNYKESVAYDFEMFEKKESNVTDIPKKDKKVNSSKSILSTIVVVLAVALCVALGLVQVGLGSRSSEINAEINIVDKEIERLNGESVSLNNQLNAIISSEELEEKAVELGMQKANSSQIRYLNLNNDDHAELVGNRSLADKFASVF